jgi:hypothetical protein
MLKQIHYISYNISNSKDTLLSAPENLGLFSVKGFFPSQNPFDLLVMTMDAKASGQSTTNSGTPVTHTILSPLRRLALNLLR